MRKLLDKLKNNKTEESEMMNEKDQWKQDHSLMRHYWSALVKIRDGVENPAKVAADALGNFIPPDSPLWERNVDLEACIRKTCNNALDLGYCDMHDCRNCDVTKTLRGPDMLDTENA